MKKETNEIEALKRNWHRDPAWEIEDTEGFEEHREELLAYSVESKARWKDQRGKKDKRLRSLYCPRRQHPGAQYPERCEVYECAWWNRDLELCNMAVPGYIAGRGLARQESQP